MSRQTKFPKVELLGVEIDRPTINQAVAHIADLAPKLKQSIYVVKPYVEFFDKELKEPGFRRALNNAYLCLPDGIGLKWAAHYKNLTKRRFIDVVVTGLELIFRPHRSGTVIPGHFGGTNFTWPLLQTCARQNLSVFLVGSPRRGSINDTADFLAANLPNLKIAGTQTGRDSRTGKYSPQLATELLNTLKTKRPDIILFGIDFQTYIPLMAKLSKQLSHGVLIGEGGTFDYQVFGGPRPKSPAIIQRVGLEWLWRLIIEPRRLRRQMAIPRFIWRIYRRYRL